MCSPGRGVAAGRRDAHTSRRTSGINVRCVSQRSWRSKASLYRFSLWPPSTVSIEPLVQPGSDPSRFEKDIAAFEAEDRLSPPPPGAVLFVGSSTIRYWDTAKAFPGLTTIKRGFGGSHVSDNTYYADRIIVPYKPTLVVFYAGDADVAAGKSADQIFADFKTLIAMIHEKLPGTQTVIIGIKPSPAHWKHMEAIRRANALVASFVARDSSGGTC